MTETCRQPGLHDHAHCVSDALARAEAVCAARGARLTALRRRVLELVWQSHRPRGAYDMLDDLGEDGRAAAPLTVYRALDFLVGQGLVHRLESLNAYVGCAGPPAAHCGQFLVCDGCGIALELNDHEVAAAILSCAGAHGFRVVRPTVEIHGLCPTCQEKPA
ncbi:MAG: Fur family transcriptional regulator [Rhodospirillaceae bacterium]